MEQGLTSYTLFLAIFPSDGNVLVTMVGPCELVVVDCRREVYEGQTSHGGEFTSRRQYYASKVQRARFFPQACGV